MRCPQKQQALVGQMLMEGYGCKQDQVAGKEWIGVAACLHICRPYNAICHRGACECLWQHTYTKGCILYAAL